MSMGIGHSSGGIQVYTIPFGMDMASNWKVPPPPTNRTLIEAIHIKINELMGRVDLALYTIYTITRACLGS